MIILLYRLYVSITVVSSHSKSIGISRVDGLSTAPPDLGCHRISAPD